MLDPAALQRLHPCLLLFDMNLSRNAVEWCGHPQEMISIIRFEVGSMGEDDRKSLWCKHSDQPGNTLKPDEISKMERGASFFKGAVLLR